MHKEGYATITITALVLGGLNSFLYYSFDKTNNEWIFYISLVFSVVFMTLILNFFRNPPRYCESNTRQIMAPCDGKVVVIEEVDEPVYFQGKRLQVSIFMSPLNVHVNRNPVGGKVRFFKYFPGKYLFAWEPKSSTENEQTFLVYESEGREIGLKQIAGALARRIVCYAKTGDSVAQGQEFGFIKFGSRVDLLLPTDTEIKVRLGDITRGGETVVAQFS